MKLKSLRIRNFRSIKEQTIEFDDYTCFVGANGSGKSNILHALNVFFGQSDIPGLDTHSLRVEDFHNKETADPIEITVTFSDLSSQAKNALKHYVRQDELIVSAEARFDETTGRAEVRQYGRRMVIKDFALFFEAEKAGEKVKQLRNIYKELKNQYSDLPYRNSITKTDMIKALRDYEERHIDKCEEIPSTDDFYGVSRGKNQLEDYIQWVYVPAVKDVVVEQTESRNTALGKLLARTVRSRINFKDPLDDIRKDLRKRYEKLLTDSQEQLAEISESLRNRFVEWAHSGATLQLKWHQDLEKAIRVDEPFAQVILGEANFEGGLTHFGHGLQRSFLLALLQELSGSDVEDGPRLILACEEPELYQHPPQARHLYDVLLRLSDQNSQIMVATHSPYFVSGEAFESVRMVRKRDGVTAITRATHGQVADAVASARERRAEKPIGQLAKIHQVLQPGLSEMFFASGVVFVEGVEDTAYVTTYLHLLGLWDEYRRLGLHLIPTNGKSNIVQPLAVANQLGILTFVIFDADGDKPDKNGIKEKHRKDNKAILNLCGVDDPDPFPDETYWGDRVVMWHSDIGNVVEKEIGNTEWEKIKEKAHAKYGHVGGLQKNILHIASSLQLAWDQDLRSSSLQKVCEKIIKVARSI